MTTLVLLGLLATAVLVGTVWSAGQPVSQAMSQSTPQTPIDAVLRQHAGRLMTLRGVVGIAEGRCAGRPCVKVYVTEKTPDLVRRIPAELDGYPVVVEATGPIRPRDPRSEDP